MVTERSLNKLLLSQGLPACHVSVIYNKDGFWPEKRQNKMTIFVKRFKGSKKKKWCPLRLFQANKTSLPLAGRVGWCHLISAVIIEPRGGAAALHIYISW